MASKEDKQVRSDLNRLLADLNTLRTARTSRADRARDLVLKCETAALSLLSMLHDPDARFRWYTARYTSDDGEATVSVARLYFDEGRRVVPLDRFRYQVDGKWREATGDEAVRFALAGKAPADLLLGMGEAQCRLQTRIVDASDAI